MGKLQAALERAKQREEIARAQSKTPVQLSATQAESTDADPGTGELIDLSSLPIVPVDWATFNNNKLLNHSGDSKHPAMGAYRMLRTRLMQSMRSNKWRVLGVCSIGQNEGKTYTSINLAISIAAEIGQEAVLIDMDLQRPSVHDQLGIDPSSFKSLRSFLENGREQHLKDLLVSPGIERLGTILSSEPLERSSDLLSSARGKELFSELRQQLPSDVVIIVDLPPLLVADDALAVAPMLDALLLVIAEGEAERSDVAEANQILQQVNLIGTVLNKSKEKDSKRTSYY